MSRVKPGSIRMLTPEEDAALLADIESDPDTYELDAEWFAHARPVIEVFPDLVEYSQRRKAMGLMPPLPDKPIRDKLEAIFRAGGAMANDPINLYDYEARAKLVLPHNNWEFIEAGSMDEFTTRRNRSAFEQLTLRPRFLRDVQERKIATTVLGQEISMPVMVAPAGSHRLAHPAGEVATAQGAGRSDTLMMLSTSSNYSMDEVADAASGPLWFQLYHRGYSFTEMLVHRAEEAGFKAIVLTVDTPVPSPKERDLRKPLQARTRPRQLPGHGRRPQRHQRHRRNRGVGCLLRSAHNLAGTGMAARSHFPAFGAEGRTHGRGCPRSGRKRG